MCSIPKHRRHLLRPIDSSRLCQWSLQTFLSLSLECFFPRRCCRWWLPWADIICSDKMSAILLWLSCKSDYLTSGGYKIRLDSISQRGAKIDCYWTVVSEKKRIWRDYFSILMLENIDQRSGWRLRKTKKGFFPYCENVYWYWGFAEGKENSTCSPYSRNSSRWNMFQMKLNRVLRWLKKRERENLRPCKAIILPIV